MINPHNVVQLLTHYISKLPPSTIHLSGYSVRDEDVAKQLYENVASILTSTEYHFENYDTLDFSFDANQLIEDEENDPEDEEDTQDTDYKEEEEEDGERSLLQQFSLEYMKKYLDSKLSQRLSESCVSCIHFDMPIIQYLD